MAVALILLAVGSVFAGYIGIPHALNGHNALGAWLEPAFGLHAVAEGAEGGAADTVTLERTLMFVSSAIAFAGIEIATFIWLRRRDIADSMARTFAPIYQLLLNKYYVDELYERTIVRPGYALSDRLLYRVIDAGLIDGIVNGLGITARLLGAVTRLAQSGVVRTYAFFMLIGFLFLMYQLVVR